MIISSTHNATFKLLCQIRDRKEPTGLLLIEGKRLCEDALRAGLIPVYFVYVEAKQALVQDWCERFLLSDQPQHILLSTTLFGRLCNTQQPQGVALIVAAPSIENGMPTIANNTLIYLCEGIRDPGNLGNIIRLADAFAFSALLLVDTVDPFNDKVVRATMGSCFRVPIYIAHDMARVISHLRENSVQLVATSPLGDDVADELLTLPCACFLGSEARGLSKAAMRLSDYCVRIPMPGRTESLNVASAAAIMGYLLSKRRIASGGKMQSGG